ncbi:hypothetical protein IMSHALPRED_003892 [Imshaugia aleurites]|uniref:Uncharacterized protein n=1 Tax=Imshaugia aleurites TaxID=172621 RepID=A0A8H3J8U9_9LECA|nr:hypothetical protein IMSHALPRED_003892 [Imshaugia aleurites]
MPPETRPNRSVHGQQKLPPPRPRNSSPDWQEARRLPPLRRSSSGWQRERRLPPQRNLSPGWQEERRPPQRNSSPGWHDGTPGRPRADSNTLPACWRNVRPAETETRDSNQGQTTSRGPKVHFQRPAERRQRTPEEDDDEESGSSSGDSLRGFVTRSKEGESRPVDKSLALSSYVHVIKHEGAGSGDEDDYVYVPYGSPSDRYL